MFVLEICLVVATLFGCVAPHGYLKHPPQRSSMWRYGYNTPINYGDNALNCGGYWICLVVGTFLGCVTPHGYLKHPPQRSSMWRYGYNTPANYQDNELNCGGFSTQFSENGGECGVCGDPANADHKPNEAGGIYATGTITETYQSGGSMEAEVLITANHLGHVEFRLCPHNDPSTAVSQSCLDQHLLQVEQDGNLATKYRIGTYQGIYHVTVRLPVGVTCSQCVLQWTYVAGNNWGCDSNNDCGVGKGYQEHFVNCADIAISPGSGQVTQTPPTAPTAQPTNAPTTPAPTPQPTNAPTTPAPTPQPTNAPTTPAPTPQPTTASATTLVPATVLPNQEPPNSCAIGIWAQVSGMHNWCKIQCAAGYCPETHCARICPTEPGRFYKRERALSCHGVGAWSVIPSTTGWCNSVCNNDPPYCPSSHCICS